MARLLKPGVEFDFGSVKLIVPPMSLGALEVMQERLSALPLLSSADPAAISTLLDAALHALNRNYPDMTRDQVADLIDVGNMGDVYECLMDAGGVKRRQQLAEKAAAEGKAQAEVSGDGGGSSPSSAPTPDGPGTTSEST